MGCNFLTRLLCLTPFLNQHSEENLMARSQFHDYHLVSPSQWPIVGSVAVFIAALGAVDYFHNSGVWLMVIGIAGILYAMLGWWRDIVREAHSGFHTPVVQLHLRYGMLLFIVSEVMFFVAWFWAYFDASLFPSDTVQTLRFDLFGGAWPPAGIETFAPWSLPFVNTLILLTSGTTVTWAHHALQEDDRQGLIYGLILTILLGISFTGLQVYEYAHAGFNFSDHIYGSTFFMATGFHGAHVIIGTIFLIVCLFRSLRGHFTPKHHFGFEAAAWYWHFVDVVWLFLFVAIYIAGAGSGAGGH